MGNIRWDAKKDEKLKAERGISFDEIVACIENHQVLAIIENPSKKYKGQKIFVIEFNNYIYYVPFIENKDNIFLKTIIPSRKLTKEYRKQGGEKNA